MGSGREFRVYAVRKNRVNAELHTLKSKSNVGDNSIALEQATMDFQPFAPRFFIVIF